MNVRKLWRKFGAGLAEGELDGALAALDTDERCWIAENNYPSTEEARNELFWKLAYDEDAGVRWRVASAYNVPEDVLRVLATDEDDKVRCAIAQRMSLPDDVARTLAQDNDPDVRYVIADNTFESQDLIAQLAGDEDVEVGMAAVRNEVKWAKFMAEVDASYRGDDEPPSANGV